VRARQRAGEVKDEKKTPEKDSPTDSVSNPKTVNSKPARRAATVAISAKFALMWAISCM